MMRLVLILGAALLLGASAPVAAPPADTPSTRPVNPVETAEIERRLDRLEAQDAARRSEQREIADLAAQQAMARAAEDQLKISIAAAVIAAVSIAFTFTALWQTRQSLELTRKTAQQELRPYLGIEKFNTDDFADADQPTLVWTIRNYGSTPATEVSIQMCVKVVNGRPDSHTFYNDDFCEPFSTQPVQPGGVSGANAIFTPGINEETREEIFAGRKAFVMAIEVSYSDQFGHRHVMRHAEVRWGKPDLLKNHFLRGFGGIS
jgi:hypothetical protein